MTFLELEQENSKLRAEIVEARELLRESLEKLGTVAHYCGFEPDRSLPVIVDQVQMKMETLPQLNQRTVEAAARWIEDHWRAVKSETGILIEEKTDATWTRFAHDGKTLVEALRKR